jgi:tRNA threonylcarbamoyladenosine biosynthesis protein TsaE
MSSWGTGNGDAERPAGTSGRPSVRAFTTTFLLFAAAYAGSLLAAEVGTAVLLKVAGVLPNGAEHLFLEPCTCFVFLVPWYFIAVVKGGTWDSWRAGGIRAFQAASARVLAIAALNGWLVGCLIIVTNALLPAVVSDLVQVIALAAGPFVGIMALVWRTHRSPDLESESYDDIRQNAERDALVRVELKSLGDTDAFGRRLGSLLFPNAVVALVGPLGAGKTHLTRAVAEGLGIANPAAVTSPTFTLVHEYPARLPIYHFDAYRLNGPNEFLDLGVSEYYEAGGVCLIEWADKVEAALPPERLTIRLTPVDESRRVAEVVGTGEKYWALADALATGETAVARSAARDTAGETP